MVKGLPLCVSHRTSFRQGVIEEALDGLTAAPVTPANPAAVLAHVRAQDPVTAHVLQGDKGHRSKGAGRGTQTQTLASMESKAERTLSFQQQK